MPDLVLLALGGAAGGFLVGLVGVGGGIVYAPVLLLAFQHRGITDPVLAPMVLGTSLFCVGLAAASGAWAQAKAGTLDRRIALATGVAAAVVLPLVGRFVTTQVWYDRDAFQIVFGVFLIGVSLAMLRERKRPDEWETDPPEPPGLTALGLSGAAAGALAAMAGVGGGMILVPLYHNVLHIPTKKSVGTSTAAIVIISVVGTLTYFGMGWGAPTPAGTVGFVDVVSGVTLAVPAMIFARFGVRAANRLPARTVRVTFAVVAILVAARLLWTAAT